VEVDLKFEPVAVCKACHPEVVFELVRPKGEDQGARAGIDC